MPPTIYVKLSVLGTVSGSGGYNDDPQERNKKTMGVLQCCAKRFIKAVTEAERRGT